MTSLLTPFQKAVYAATRRIPRGSAATYAQIARAIGKPRAVRAVGNALNANPFAPRIPCHRVVKSNLCVGGFTHGAAAKVRLLKKEGIVIRNNKVATTCLFNKISK